MLMCYLGVVFTYFFGFSFVPVLIRFLPFSHPPAILLSPLHPISLLPPFTPFLIPPLSHTSPPLSSPMKMAKQHPPGLEEDFDPYPPGTHPPSQPPAPLLYPPRPQSSMDILHQRLGITQVCMCVHACVRACTCVCVCVCVCVHVCATFESPLTSKSSHLHA